jgi:hypothetical protein
VAKEPPVEPAPEPDDEPRAGEVEPPRGSVAVVPSGAPGALHPALEGEWRQLDVTRRELAAEWARLGAARERTESVYERLDFLREHLDAERRQLERQRERMWAERFQLVSETRPREPKPVAADRPWRSAASLLLEAVVVMRSAVARRARHPIAGHPGDAGAGTRREPRELPPGDS